MEGTSDEPLTIKTVSGGVGEEDDHQEAGKTVSSPSSATTTVGLQQQQVQSGISTQQDKPSSPSSLNQSNSSIDLLADESMNESKNSSASEDGGCTNISDNVAGSITSSTNSGGKKINIGESIAELENNNNNSNNKSITLHPIATTIKTSATNQNVVTIQPVSSLTLTSSSSIQQSSSATLVSKSSSASSSLTSSSTSSTTLSAAAVSLASRTHIIPPASASVSSAFSTIAATVTNPIATTTSNIISVNATSSSAVATSTIPSTNQSGSTNSTTTTNPTITGSGNKLYLINTPKFDSIKIIEWKDGIGTLPGSKLKFKVNEYGTLEMLYDDDKVGDKSIVKPVESVKAPAESSNGSNNNNNNNNNNLSITLLAECVNCKIKGVKSNFIRNGRFCSQDCATKQSENLKIFSKTSTSANNNTNSNSANNLNYSNSSNNNSNVVKPESVKKKIFYHEGRMYVDMIGERVTIRKPLFINRSDLHGTGRSETPDGLDLLDANEEIENIDSFTGINVPHKKFNWKEYLEDTKSFCAPVKCFKESQSFPSVKNGFKVGMKLEGIDPHNPALYCVLSVAEVVGFRLRLHFDGYPDIYDFWVNADSPFIFPAGWCQKTGRKLESPKDMLGTFSWNSYLQTSKSQSAPNYLFTCVKPSYSLSQFRVGMRLEAVDKANTSLVCVASVADILDNYILVHFDGWDDSYDYWISMSSPYIHPINWCHERGKPLTPPKDHPKQSEKFKWADYLQETKSTAVPPKAFRLRQANSFRAGMKCEVVDKRYPRLIRVATIVDRRSHSVKIHFDGWQEKFDYWLDDDSCDIHPVNWCAKTNHPLQPPPNYFRKYPDSINCPTPGCRGFGSIKSARFSTHNTFTNCPYSEENMERELPDRFGRDFSDEEMNPKSPLQGEELSCPPSPTSFSDLRRKRKRKRENSGSSASDSVKISRPSTPSSSFFHNNLQNSKHNYSATISTLHQAIYSLRMNPQQTNETPMAWEKHSKSLLSFAEKVNASEVLKWTPDKVAQFVSTIPGCQDFGQCFEEEIIDGEAFLLLNQTDLVTHLGIKLGPAVKIYNSILVIRDNIDA
ncbi:lethal(3)malignant brain tumor-like protein 4 [Panonychus citri]|uniref:lethal(3)malignant brain tumor-like protein 4 n=1 Tax=Panonychus citri TaxID=50023 RepID=UPI002307D109|nr:lethal(3)malignant brain tumor-like protein 4 [Panonychus citri]